MNQTDEDAINTMMNSTEAGDDWEPSVFARIVYSSFLYHGIPGVAMMMGGSAYLLLSLIRARSLPRGQSFCATYVPEPNYRMIHSVSIGVLVVIVLASIRQVTGPCFDSANPSFFCFLNQPGHVAMYGSYASICLVALLECAGRVPVDSWRCAGVLCALLNYFLMAGHAEMKPTPEDRLTHSLWGDLELYHAMIGAYSIYDTSSLIMYLATWMMFIVKGFWIVLSGIELGSQVMTMEDIRPIFVLLLLGVTGLTTLIGAFYGNIQYEYDLSFRNDRPNLHSNQGGRNQISTATSMDTDYKHLLKTADDGNENMTFQDEI